MRPPHHRDALPADAAALLDAVRRGSLDHAVELLRPEFEEWARAFDVAGASDEELADGWAATASGRDRTLLETVPAAVLSRSAREALLQADGYLRDAATALRPWDWDLSAVQCPVTIRHGAADESASPRNAQWLLAHVPDASGGVAPAETHLAALHDHWPELLATVVG